MLKSIKKVFTVFLCAVLCLSSIHLVSLADSSSSEGERAALISELKTAWSEMYQTNTVANLKTDKAGDNADISGIGVTFTETSNSETGYIFKKEAYDGTEYGARMIFNSTVYDKYSGAYKYFDSNLTDFNSAFTDNDDVYITLNTGDLTTGGKIMFSLYYTGYKAKHEYIDVTEANKEIKLSIKEQFGFENLSDALTQVFDNTNQTLQHIRISFSKDLVTTGAKIYPIKTFNQAELPEGCKDFGIIEWYNAAAALDISNYGNTDKFTAALKNVKDYIDKNGQEELAISLLKDAWTSMYQLNTVANLRITDTTNNPSNLGINFTDISNSETGYVFDKAAYTGTDYSTRMVFNSTVYDGYSKDYKWFNSNLTGFNSIFTDNDDLILTLNTGNVKANGELLFSLYYKGSKTKHYRLPINESNKEIKLSIKDSFGFEKLSDALMQNFENQDRSLHEIRLSFSGSLVTEGAKVCPIKALRYPELPGNSGSYTAYDWLDAAQSFDYSGYLNTEDFVKATNELESALYTPVEIAEKKLRAAWGQMYTDKFFATISGKDNLFDASEDAYTGEAVLNNNIKVSTEDIAAIGEKYTVIDKPRGKHMTAIFHERGGNYQCLGLADRIKSYDTIVLRVYTGDITNNGMLSVSVVDHDWKRNNVDYNLTPNDSNKWIEVDMVKGLGFADMDTFVYPDPENEKLKPNKVDIIANPGLEFEGMVVGMLAGRTYCPAPDSDISAEELLNIALELDIDNYRNTDGFVSGMKQLYKAIHGVELPELSALHFVDNESNVKILVERESRIDDIDVVGIRSTKNNISNEMKKWIADYSFKSIENAYKIELVNSKGKIADIGNRKATVTFNLPKGVQANEVNLLEMSGDDFKLVNCVYYEDKLVFDTENFINGKSYAILVLS